MKAGKEGLICGWSGDAIKNIVTGKEEKVEFVARDNRVGELALEPTTGKLESSCVRGHVSQGNDEVSVS